MLIDTHAHLDFSDFDTSARKEVIDRALEAGVKYIINVSSDIRGCSASLKLSQDYENIFAAVGIHPHSASGTKEEDFQLTRELLRNKKVIAVGEVGLDYYRNLSPEGKQKEWFNRFIGLALESGLPLIIHSRQAEEDTVSLLKAGSREKLKGVVHCFSGSLSFCRQCLDLGLDISFTCNITYKKSDGLREIVKYVPQDRLLLETDCPYLAPEGLRGKRNEPANIRLLAQFIASLRGCSFEEIARDTSNNAIRLFQIE